MATLSERIKMQNLENSSNEIGVKGKDISLNIEITEYPQGATVDRLKLEVAKKIAAIPVWFEYSIEEQRDLVSSIFETLSQSSEFSEICEGDFWLLLNDFKSQVRGLGALDFVLAISDVSEVLVTEQADVRVTGAQQEPNFSLTLPHFSKLVKYLADKTKSKSSVVEYKDFGLKMTLVREPLCAPQIFLSKTGGNYRSVSDLIEACVLTSKTSDLLVKSIEEKKNIIINSYENVCADYLFYSLLKEIKEPLVLLQNSEFLGDLGDNVIKFNTSNISEKEGEILIENLLRFGVKYIFADSIPDGILHKILNSVNSNIGVVAFAKNNPPKANVNVLIQLTFKGLDYKFID